MTKSEKYKILVVDDEVDICRALEFMLINEGFSVAAVNSGEGALELFGKQRFDLVLSDFMMDGMSGLDLLLEVKKLSEEHIRKIRGNPVEASKTLKNPRVFAQELTRGTKLGTMLFGFESGLKKAQKRIKKRQNSKK